MSTAFDAFLSLTFSAIAWDAFRPHYGSVHLQRGIVFTLVCLCFLLVTLGMALNKAWARWCSLLGMLTMLAFCALSFWDGYLRAKATFSGEEGGEAGVAVLLGVPTLISLIALWVTTLKDKQQSE